MRNFIRLVILFTIVIYIPDEKTNEIEVYDYSENEKISVTCAEGVSRSECLYGQKVVEKVEVISYEDIQNFVMRGPYSF